MSAKKINSIADLGRILAALPRQGASVPIYVVAGPIFADGDLRADSGLSTKSAKRTTKRSTAQPEQATNTTKAFASFPPRSRELALHRREMILAYYAALEYGLAKNRAERAAKCAWMQLTGENINGRSVRRWARRIERDGGISKATDADYVDGRPGRKKDRK